MSRRRQIYEGKAKILYEGPEPGTLIQYFKDDATAFNAQKRGTISGKGVLNNRISERVFTLLGTIGIPTHFIRRLNMREQLIRQVEIIPIEVVVRNVAAGSLSKPLRTVPVLGINKPIAFPFETHRPICHRRHPGRAVAPALCAPGSEFTHSGCKD